MLLCKLMLLLEKLIFNQENRSYASQENDFRVKMRPFAYFACGHRAWRTGDESRPQRLIYYC